MSKHYLIALGSNVRHAAYGRPRNVLAAAIDRLDGGGIKISSKADIIASDPMGPSLRRYANGAVIIETDLSPEDLLASLQQIERDFGRTARGQRWGARVLDLDIVLWSGGSFASDALIIPHPAFRERAFVLSSAALIAPAWRDPITNLTPKQLFARLTRPRRAPRGSAGGRALSSVGRATDF